MQTYNIHEAAKVLKCHHTTICHMCRTGEIEAFKAGRAWVITETALENYIAAKQNSQQQAVIGRRSKAQCQSISTNMGYGKYPFVHQAVSALDVLLEQPTDNSRKSCTIN